MSKNAGLAKTRKAVAKRFKVTATGKVLRRKQGKRHILQNKSRKRKRNLGKVALVAEVDKRPNDPREPSVLALIHAPRPPLTGGRDAPVWFLFREPTIR
jgi:large subunit ribosomal protein L35